MKALTNLEVLPVHALLHIVRHNHHDVAARRELERRGWSPEYVQFYAE